MLRSLRLTTGLTAEDVAQRLGFSRSKLSRLENGRRGASQVVILQLCHLYQVGEEQRLHLSELAAEGKQRMHRPSFSLPHYDYYIGLEAEAATIYDYGLAIVPGLLQTSEYARAIVSIGVPEQEQRIVNERVRSRIARQQLLRSEGAPEFEVILDESVLHRVVGGPEVMAGQLRRLLEASELPNVTIRVVPFDAGTVPAGVNKFVILRFALPSIADIVLIEDLTSNRWREDPGEVATYILTFQTLTDLSVDPAVSEAMILSKLTVYETRIR
jgi:transcriptional regulator with XRE-family HTH domain